MTIFHIWLRELEDIGLVTSKSRSYRFSSNIVEQTVLTLFSRNRQEVLFEICDMLFITRYVRPSTYVKRKGEVCICLEPMHDLLLVSTIVKNIDIPSVKSGDKDHICLSHPSLDNSEFFGMVLSKIPEIVPSEKVLEYCTEILFWACCYGKRQMVHELEKYMCQLGIMNGEIINKALKHVSYCDNACEKILNTLINSQFGTLVESDTIVQLLRKSATIGFNPQAFQTILSKKTNKSIDDLYTYLSEAEVIHNGSFVCVVLNQCLEYKPTEKQLMKIVLGCISTGIHPNKSFLDTAMSRFSLETFKSIFDECIRLSTNSEFCLYLLRTWISHAADDSYIYFLYESVIVKPMTQTWYPEYINDENSKSFSSIVVDI